MMRLPWLYVFEELYPYVRSVMAVKFSKANFKQVAIADILGVTQAMVSKYLGGTVKRPPREFEKVLRGIGEEIAEFILAGGSKEEAMVLLVERFNELFSERKFCELYSRYAKIDERNCPIILNVVSPTVEPLKALSMALQRLLQDAVFPNLIPQVRSNFVFCLFNAKEIFEVAGIPGRITRVGSRAFALPPAYGASSYLAKVLLKVHKKDPKIRSILNIRYGEDILSALNSSNLEYLVVTSLEEVISSIETFPDVIIEEGDRSREPGTYILGRSPFDVLRKLKLIEKGLL